MFYAFMITTQTTLNYTFDEDDDEEDGHFSHSLEVLTSLAVDWGVRRGLLLRLSSDRIAWHLLRLNVSCAL